MSLGIIRSISFYWMANHYNFDRTIRPSRYCVTKDDRNYESETGALVDQSMVKEKGRLQPEKCLWWIWSRDASLAMKN